MGDRYEKTTAGRAEVRLKTLSLPRHQRNLLLLIQPDRPASDWLAQVNGCAAANLARLQELEIGRAHV